MVNYELPLNLKPAINYVGKDSKRKRINQTNS